MTTPAARYAAANEALTAAETRAANAEYAIGQLTEKWRATRALLTAIEEQQRDADTEYTIAVNRLNAAEDTAQAAYTELLAITADNAGNQHHPAGCRYCASSSSEGHTYTGSNA